MRFLLCVSLLLLFALPLRAETPWAAAEAIRTETGRIERLLYRAPAPAHEQEIKERLARMAGAWGAVAGEFAPENAAAVADALAEHAARANAGDAPATARARQRLWAQLLIAARVRLLDAIAANEPRAASNWLTIRDYARASGDTAAVLAVQALGAGTLAPDAARATVEAELLTVAASELRLALARAGKDAAEGHATQYAGEIGRIEGMVVYLEESLAAHLGTEGMTALSDDIARAADDPEALGSIETRLQGFAPVAIAPEELTRRARLLRRFTAMVWEEYGAGVRGGEIRQPMEYNEALMFRDRAAMILGDLAPQMADPEKSARIAALLAEADRLMKARADGVEPVIADALAQIDAAFGTGAQDGGVAVAFDALDAALEELRLIAHAGDWDEAELKRLEAYSWFDPDIEQRLVPRAPSMALRLESRFWEGSADRPGLGSLIARRDGGSALSTEIEEIKAELARARERIEARTTAFGSALQSAGIVFREGLEAVLILAALMAALRAEGAEPARFRAPVSWAVLLALAASFALWAAARWLISISTLAREALEGGTALVAAAVLIWLVVGLAGGGGHTSAFRARLAGVATPMTVALLAFLVVFREGFETVLFYEALLVDAAPLPVLAGLGLGGAAALAAGWAVLASGRRLPLGLFFRATTILLAALAVMLVGAGVRGLQTAALISATPVGWFPDRDWLQLWFGLFPVLEPLVAQSIAVAIILAAPLLRRLKAAHV